MAINYPGTFEVRIKYTTDEPAVIQEHELRLSCEMSTEASPGDPFADWETFWKDGTGAHPLSTDVENLLGLVTDFYNTQVSFTVAELWEYAPGTFDAVYRSSYAPTANAGTSAVTTKDASQTIVSCRTSGGGIFKIDMRGTIQDFGSAQAWTFGNSLALALGNYLLDDEYPWIGRDGTYPVVPLRFLPGLNERAFKQIYR